MIHTFFYSAIDAMDDMSNISYTNDNSSNTMDIDSERVVKSLATTFGVFSAAAIALNIIVIIYIICIRFRCRNRPKEELFILSLAFADLLGAVQAGIFCLRVHEIIFLTSLKAQNTMREFSIASSGMASLSTLFHAIAITVDRCVLLKYTLHYKSWVTKRRIVICICIIWILAAIIASTQFWFPGKKWGEKIIDWVFTTGTITASFFFCVTYSIMIAFSCRKGQAEHQKEFIIKRSQRKNSKSFYTTALSIAIVISFVVCNLPYAAINVIFLGEGFDVVTALSLFTLLTLNTLLDPLLYSLIGILSKRDNSIGRRKSILTMSTSGFIASRTAIQI